MARRNEKDSSNVANFDADVQEAQAARAAERERLADVARAEAQARQEREARAQEARDRAEVQAAERAERDRRASEQAQRDAAERAEYERQQRVGEEQLARERADAAEKLRQEAQDRADIAATERADRDRLQRESEAQAKAEADHKARVDKDAADAVAQDKADREAAERADQDRLQKVADAKAAQELADRRRQTQETADRRAAAQARTLESLKRKAEERKVADAAAKAEADRKARDAAAIKEREAAAQRQREQALAAERQRLAAVLKAKAEADEREAAQVRLDSERRQVAEREAEQERQSKAETDRRNAEESRKKQLEDARLESENRAKAELEEKARTERARVEREARLARERAEADARETAEQQARAKADLERREIEAREKAESERKAQAERDRLESERAAREALEVEQKRAELRAEADRKAAREKDEAEATAKAAEESRRAAEAQAAKDLAADREETARMEREARKPLSAEDQARIAEEEKTRQAGALKAVESGVAGILEERAVAAADKGGVETVADVEAEAQRQRAQAEEIQRRAAEEVAAHEATVVDFNKRQGAAFAEIDTEAESLYGVWEGKGWYEGKNEAGETVRKPEPFKDAVIVPDPSGVTIQTTTPFGGATLAKKGLDRDIDAQRDMLKAKAERGEEITDADVAPINRLVDEFNRRSTALAERSAEAVKRFGAEAGILNQRAEVIGQRNELRTIDVSTQAARLQANIEAVNFRSERAYAKAVETAENKLAGEIAAAGVERRDAEAIAKEALEDARVRADAEQKATERLDAKTLGEGEVEIQGQRVMDLSRQGTLVEVAEAAPKAIDVKLSPTGDITVAALKAMGEGEAEIEQQRFLEGGVEVAEPAAHAVYVDSLQQFAADLRASTQPGEAIPITAESKVIADLGRIAPDLNIVVAEAPVPAKPTVQVAQPTLPGNTIVIDMTGGQSGNSTAAVFKPPEPKTPEELAREHSILAGFIPVYGTIVGTKELVRAWDDLSTSGKSIGVALTALSAAGDIVMVGQGAALGIRTVATAAKGAKGARIVQEVTLDVAKAEEAASFAATAAKAGKPASVEVFAANAARASEDLQKVVRLNPDVQDIRIITGTASGEIKSASRVAEELATGRTIDPRLARPEVQSVAGRLPNTDEIRKANAILRDLAETRAAEIAEIRARVPAQPTVGAVRQADAAIAQLKRPASVVMAVERTPTKTEVKQIVQAVRKADHIDTVHIEANNPFRGAATEIKFQAVQDAVAQIEPPRVSMVGGKVKVEPAAISREEFLKAGGATDKSVAEIVRDTAPSFQKETIAGRSRAAVFEDVGKEYGPKSKVGKAITDAERKAAEFEKQTKSLTDGLNAKPLRPIGAPKGRVIKADRIDTAPITRADEAPEVVRRIRITDEPGSGRAVSRPRSALPREGGGRGVTVAERTQVADAVMPLGRRLLSVGGGRRTFALPRAPGLPARVPARPGTPAAPGTSPRAPTVPTPGRPLVEPGTPVPTPGPVVPGRVPVSPTAPRGPEPGQRPARQPSEPRQPVRPETPTTPQRPLAPERIETTAPSPARPQQPVREPGRPPSPVREVPGPRRGEPVRAPERRGVPLTEVPPPERSTPERPAAKPSPTVTPGVIPVTGTAPGTDVSVTPIVVPAPGVVELPVPTPTPEPKPEPRPEPQPEAVKVRTAIKTRQARIKEDTAKRLRRGGPTTERAYKAPKGKPNPAKAAWPSGILQRQKDLNTGKVEYGRGFLARFDPHADPVQGFTITKFAVRRPKSLIVDNVGAFVARIRPDRNVIEFHRKVKLD